MIAGKKDPLDWYYVFAAKCRSVLWHLCVHPRDGQNGTRKAFAIAFVAAMLSTAFTFWN